MPAPSSAAGKALKPVNTPAPSLSSASVNVLKPATAPDPDPAPAPSSESAETPSKTSGEDEAPPTADRPLVAASTSQAAPTGAETAIGGGNRFPIGPLAAGSGAIAAACFAAIAASYILRVDRFATWWATLIFSAVGIVLVALTVSSMSGRWTRGRRLCGTVAVLVGVAAAVGGASSLRQKAAASKDFHLIVGELKSIELDPKTGQWLIKDVLPPDGHTPCKGSIVPVLVFKRGSQQRPPDRLTPVFDVDLYGAMPAGLRASSVQDAKTLAFVDWWYNPVGKAPGKGGGKGMAFVGTCTITVVDRSTRRIIDSKTLVSPEIPTVQGGNHEFGPQPSVEEVIQYLQSVPVTK